MSFTIKGSVVGEERGEGLSGLTVRAFDKDLFYDDLLGTAVTDADGCFIITYEESDYQELFDANPDIYLQLKKADGTLLYSSENSVRFAESAEEVFHVKIPDPLPVPVLSNPNYTAMDLRYLMLVVNKAQKEGKLEEVFSALREAGKIQPDAQLLMPSVLLNSLISKFKFMALCSGATATATVTIGTMAVLSANRTVGFTYSYTGAPTCTVLTQSVRLMVGGISMQVNQLTDSGSAFTGSIPVAAGAMTVGTAVTISATFTESSAVCDTCILPTPTVTGAATIA